MFTVYRYTKQPFPLPPSISLTLVNPSNMSYTAVTQITQTDNTCRHQPARNSCVLWIIIVYFKRCLLDLKGTFAKYNIRRFHTGVLFPVLFLFSSNSSWDFAFTPKRELSSWELFPPFQCLLKRWYYPGEKKVPISDWLSGLQTTPRKTLKSFVKPPFYLLALALLALAQRTNGERLTYGTQNKTWERWRWGGVGVLAIYSEGFSRSCWESQQLLLKPVPNWALSAGCWALSAGH